MAVNLTYAIGTGYCEYAGLSTDTKPTEGVGTGSIFVEVDTGNVFFFDSVSAEWVEQFSFQSEDSGAKSSPKLSMGLTKSAPTPQDDEPTEEEPEEEEAEPESEEPIKDEIEPEEATER